MPFSWCKREQVWSQSLLKFTKNGVEVKRVWDTAASLTSPPEGTKLSVISGYAPRGGRDLGDNTLPETRESGERRRCQ